MEAHGLGLLLLATVISSATAAVPPSAIDSTMEYFYVLVNTPVQGVPIFARPTISTAAEYFFRSPNVQTIHLFKVSGAPQLMAIVKVLKPGALCDLVLDVTSLGLEITSIPLYSFEGHALYLGANKLLAAAPLRVIPCLRAHAFKITVAPSGKSADYRSLLANLTTELLNFKAAGINLDLYKVLAALPAQYLVIGCSYLSVFDELGVSLQSIKEDLGAFEISDVTALVRYTPLFGASSTCAWGFPYLTKTTPLGF